LEGEKGAKWKDARAHNGDRTRASQGGFAVSRGRKGGTKRRRRSQPWDQSEKWTKALKTAEEGSREGKGNRDEWGGKLPKGKATEKRGVTVWFLFILMTTIPEIWTKQRGGDLELGETGRGVRFRPLPQRDLGGELKGTANGGMPKEWAQTGDLLQSPKRAELILEYTSKKEKKKLSAWGKRGKRARSV